jgi:amylosucrase
MSFARGEVFEENPRTSDRRVSGSTASLAGLEAALESGDDAAIEMAYNRIRLLYAVAAGAGGIPIIWSNDELGTTNDHGYVDDAHRATDNRWLHRSALDSTRMSLRTDPTTPEGRVFADIAAVMHARKNTPEVHSAAAAHPVATGSNHVLGILRESARGDLLIAANVSPEPQAITPIGLRDLGFSGPLRDRLTDEPIAANSAIHLDPYDVLWVVSGRE